MTNQEKQIFELGRVQGMAEMKILILSAIDEKFTKHISLVAESDLLLKAEECIELKRLEDLLPE